MKNSSASRIATTGIMLCMLLLSSLNYAVVAAVKRPSSDISASIPEQWKSNIIKEQNGAVTSFSLVNGNSAPVFLFSVTQIAEQEWIKMKTQMPEIKIIQHKDGMIYYSYKNPKEKIKGVNSSLYSQVYPYLDQMISSVQIN
ncbi:MAG: hypothetical protein K1X61_04225 [Chitinophagales bacterium]|nr:hypothetical protein [Chitinophagales bacterium]